MNWTKSDNQYIRRMKCFKFYSMYWNEKHYFYLLENKQPTTNPIIRPPTLKISLINSTKPLNHTLPDSKALPEISGTNVNTKANYFHNAE